MKVKAPLSFEKKEDRLSNIVFGFLSAAGLYTISGILLVLLAKVSFLPFVYNYFKGVFLPFYVILFILTFILVKDKKVFRWSYLISALLILLVYVLTTLVPALGK